MKRLTAHIKQITLFLLLGIFVLSSTGFNVCIHTCRYSGNTDYSLVLQHSESCCGDKAESKSCCDDKDTYFKLDVAKKMDDETRLVPHKLLVIIATILPHYLIDIAPDYSSVFSGHSPPILSARTVLSMVQVFRI